MKPIIAGVPQGSDLLLILYNIYTANMPTSRKTLLTAILTSEKDPVAAINTLQPHLNKINY
jgi:hypothetical protein